MAKPSEKLAQSLQILKKLQSEGIVAIRSRDISRVHRERLIKNSFLKEVVKGWFIGIRPEGIVGESTDWYSSFWGFFPRYFQTRFGEEWSLSPEQSIQLFVGNKTVPQQLLVRAPKAQNNMTSLIYGVSILEVRAKLPDPKEIRNKEGMRLFSLPAALVFCSPGFFRQNPIDVRSALAMIKDASEILRLLLEGGHNFVAGRLVGAFRNNQQDRIADEILETMHSAGYETRENDPFASPSMPISLSDNRSKYVNRIRLMWQQMRGPVLEEFPSMKFGKVSTEDYLGRIEDEYVEDAYNSLSIEGYRITPELIERVRTGEWDPENIETDQEHKNALVARGYWLAWQSVEQSIKKVLEGENPGVVVEEDHKVWYREMFSPSILAGFLRPSDLAGYRNEQVFIRQSMHVPPNPKAVPEMMGEFFHLLTSEKEPTVRIVLGHFIFVYIHPYMDGNGRIGRFLMNLMLAAARYPWMTIPLGDRKTYMTALEKASVHQNIKPFANYLSGLLSKSHKKFS
ncbi:MAG: Fic family protein [Alphaproteobacteria bacterium]|nr:Fic family protein [Alphaproteobacteria bacterium]MBT5389607.1 Fic family protein [Alphaproteobacteria bacterium]MBT5540171.1 Fic family protein [Alphaproteobacteria bacterium]